MGLREELIERANKIAEHPMSCMGYDPDYPIEDLAGALAVLVSLEYKEFDTGELYELLASSFPVESNNS